MMRLKRWQVWLGFMAFPSIAIPFILFDGGLWLAVGYAVVLSGFCWCGVLIAQSETEKEKTRPPAQPVPWLGSNQN